MKGNNRFKATVAALVLSALIPMTLLPSSAMTPLPPTLLDGSPSEGVNIPTESGILIENQSITLDISDFPAPHDEDSFKEYKGNVKTEYTLYNPTDSEITIKVAFPLGHTPHYYYGVSENPEESKYSVMIDGKAADTTLRHAVDFSYYDEPADFITLISDEYIESELCGPDMTVTIYTFKQSGVAAVGDPFVGFDIKRDSIPGSCIYLGEYAHAWDQKGGYRRFNTRAGENGSISELTVFGEDLKQMPDWKFYKDVGVEDGEEIAGKMEFVSKRTVTFSDYVLEYYDPSLGISQVDWFNMAATEISRTIEYGHEYTSLDGLRTAFKNYLVSGLVYEITIAPGDRVINTLTAPLYPWIETMYEPNTFNYRYLLSESNAEIFTGNINITVNTPYYMIYNGGFDFEKTDGGYSLTLNPTENLSDGAKVTLGEFNFTLCESENPEVVESEAPVAMFIIMIIALPILLVIAIADAIIDGVNYLINLIK